MGPAASVHAYGKGTYASSAREIASPMRPKVAVSNTACFTHKAWTFFTNWIPSVVV